MKITLCGSIAFFNEMLSIKKELEDLGHEVKMPPTEIEDENGNMIPVKDYYKMRKTETNDDSWVWERKGEAIKLHFKKVEWSDAILVLNYKKREIDGYIGANTLIEMSLAFYLNKSIFLLNKVPEIDYKEEILGLRPIVINLDLKKIKPINHP